MVVELVTDRTERLEPGARLYGGKGQPFDVVASRRHQGRWLVTLAGIDDRSAADALRGVVLKAPPLEDPGALWVHQLIGAMVAEAEGAERGKVVAVEANPASDLLVLEDGHLVPLRFVVEATADRLVIDPPPGLFD